MGKYKVLFLSEKETFISRVLIKKVQDDGIACEYVPATIDAVNEKINDASLLVLFMEDGELPESYVLHFLADAMEENNLRMIVIGAEKDIFHLCDRIPGDLVYKTFVRPVDNSRFTKAVTDYFTSADKGAFKKSILVVDDDSHYLIMVRQWLKDTYNVAMANSGLQAIKWLGSNHADLILLDYEMPVTSGPQVLEMLRNDTETASIPVMFLTGKSDKDSVMAVVSLKPEGYFLKSIKQDELLEKLQEFFILHK